ncbi:MAG: hypothetical protein JWN80_637 [Microbacteriaceae bacterium]|nr:hypothetical protein [Microbacteriaceae bacterium]
MRRSLATTSIVAGGVALTLLLAGCGTQGTPTGGSTGKATVAPSATPTPSATATDVLFTITANVRGADGSTIGIQLTAHKPLTYSDPAAKTYESTFLGQCGDGKGGTVPRDTAYLAANGSILVPIDITSTISGKTFVAPVGITLGSPYFGSAIIGKSVVPSDTTAPCYNGYQWVTSGRVHAIADFESGQPGPDLKLWRYGLYGFGLADGSNATIEACKITITPLGAADEVASVTGWDTSAPQSGLTCVIGYSGE